MPAKNASVSQKKRTPSAKKASSPSKKPFPALALWEAHAMSLPTDDYRVRVPQHVVLGEAVDVALFFQSYYESRKAKGSTPARPGLDTALNEKRGFTAKTGTEILTLRDAVQQAQSRYLLSARPAEAAPTDRAVFVLDEITAALEYLFDDGVEDERDAQLASVAAAHADDPSSTDALAAELDDYSALAETYRSELAGLGGFDPAVIDEARDLAIALRARPAARAPVSEEARTALNLRNRLLTLLSDRMAMVRSAARFVFRRHPAIAREVTSTYERRRRAASRKAAQNPPVAEPKAAAPAPVVA